MAGDPGLFMTLSARLDGSTSAAFAAFERGATQAGNRGAAALGRTGREVDQIERKLRATAAGLAAFQGPLGGVASRFNAVAQLFQFTGRGIAATIGLIAGSGALLAAGADIQAYQARLKALSTSQADFASSQQLIARVSKDTRSDIGSTIDFYTRLRAASESLGLTQKQLGDTMSVVQKSIQLSGANAQQAAAAQTQFIQGLTSANGLSGDEFKSLGENAVTVLQAIAKGLKQTGAIPGFDGTISSLRELGRQGRLTADVLVPALAAVKSSVDESFGKMPVTISQATAAFKNSLTTLVINLEQTTGILSKTAGGISFVSENLKLFGGAATVAGVALASRFLAPLVATGAASVRVAAQLALAAAGFEGPVSRAYAGVRALNGFKAAGAGVIGLFGGPWGLALTAAAGVAFHLATKQDATAAAAERMGISESDLVAKVKAATGAIGAQNEVLDGNISRLNQINRLTAEKNLDEAKEASASGRRDLFQGLQDTGSFAALAPKDYSQLRSTILGGKSYAEIAAQIDKLAGKNKAFAAAIVADRDFIDRNIGRKSIVDTIYDVGAADEAALDAQRKLSALGKAVEKAASATAPNSKLKTKAQLDSAAILASIDAGTQSIAAAGARRRDALAKLEAQFPKIGSAPAEKQSEYATQRAEIEARYRSEIEGVRDAAAAKREAAAGERTAAAAARAERRAAIADETSYLQILNRLNPNTSRAKQAEALRIEVEGLSKKRAAAGLPGYSDAELSAIDAGIRRFLVQPLIDANITAQEQANIQNLILAGREADAEVLQRAVGLIKDGVAAKDIDLNQTREQVVAERLRNRAIQDRNTLIEIQAREVAAIQQSFRDLFAGGGVGNFGKSLLAGFKNSFADELSFKLFGNAEQDTRDALNNTTTALDDLRAAMGDLEAALRGEPSSLGALGGAANDNAVLPGGVAGKAGSAVGVIAGLAADVSKGVANLPSSVGGAIKNNPVSRASKTVEDRLNNTFADFGRKIDKTFGTGGVFEKLGSFGGSALAGAATGDLVNGVLGGSKSAKLGGQIGGALGGVAEAFGLPFGKEIGAVLGNIVGGLFKKNPYGDAAATVGANGKVSFGSQKVRGEGSSENLATLTSSLSSVFDALTQNLGAKLSPGASLGGIGFNDDNYYFSPTSATFKAKDKQVFATAEDAVFAALKNAIDKGIVGGVRAGTKNLLLASKDLEFQLSKAIKFEAVFTDLRKATDPVGAAVDDLNKKFLELKDIFVEAGASSDEFGKLQQLYDLQRVDALKTAGNASLQTLKSYLTELTTSSGSGLSLRDRQSAALAEFNPFAADIGAGKSVDVSAYQAAAENLRSVEQELFGSTQQYFERLNQITGLTKKAISDQTNVTSIADALNLSPVTTGLTSLQNALLAQGFETNTLLAQIAANNGSFAGFSGDGYNMRNF